MSDRLEFRRRARPPRLAQERFDALKAVSGHDWLLGGPWEALEPAVLAIAVLGYGDKLTPAQRDRWSRVLALLSEETEAHLGEAG